MIPTKSYTNKDKYEIATISYLLRKGTSTQNELSKFLGTSQPSVSRMLNNLQKKGMIEISLDQDLDNNLKGRKRQVAKLNAKAGSWYGCELKSEGFEAVLTDMKSNVLENSKAKWKDTDPEKMSDQLANALKKIHGKPLLQSPAVKGLGVAVRGRIVEDHIEFSSSFPEIVGYPLKKELSKRLGGIPVYLASLGISNMYAEIRQSFEEFQSSKYPIVSFYWAEGLVFSVMTNPNVLLQGTGTHTGWDFSHVVVNEHGNLCKCGRKGCVETIISSDVIANELKFLLTFSDDQKSSAREMIHKASSLAESGQEIFQNYFNNKIKLMLKAANPLLQIISPYKLITGGWLFEDNPWLRKRFIRLVKDCLPEDLADSLVFEDSKISSNATALGAAEYACHSAINEPLLQTLEF